LLFGSAVNLKTPKVQVNLPIALLARAEVIRHVRRQWRSQQIAMIAMITMKVPKAMGK